MLATVAELLPSRRHHRVPSVVGVYMGLPQKRLANTGGQGILWNSLSWNSNLSQMFQTSQTGNSHRLFIARAQSHHKKPNSSRENRIPTSFSNIEVEVWKRDDEDGGGNDCCDKVDIVCKVGARLVNVFATALCLPRVINMIVITFAFAVISF